MTNGTKILIGIVVVATIITGIIVGAGANKSKETQQNNTSIMDEYLNSDKKENNVEENVVGNEMTNEVENKVNNTTESENKTTTNTVVNNTSSTTIVGKEEQESQKENTSANDEDTAIELAKKEWGINVDAYIFEAEKNSDGTFEVTVRNQNDRNVVTVYQVNVKTGAVTE
ncbi:hypothetical protein EGR52_07595 [bacterium]|nr:hypothetical protein [bacterium]